VEVIKSYRAPVDAPRDLRGVLQSQERRVEGSADSHRALPKRESSPALRLKGGKKLRDELLKGWKYSKHYVDSAINSVIGLVNFIN